MKSLLLLLMLCLSLSTTLLAQEPAPTVEITIDEATKLKAADLLLALLQYSISFDGAFTEIKGDIIKTYGDGTEVLRITKLEKTIQKTHSLIRLPSKSLNYIATFDAVGSQALIAAITIEIPKNATFKSESKQTKENEISYYLKANDKKICTLTYTTSTGKSDLLFFAGN